MSSTILGDKYMDNKPYICTDTSQIKKSCDACDGRECDNIITDLLSVFPKDALGLAAPQILIFKRVFLARINNSLLAFINPTIQRSSPDLNSSTESCLSIPNVIRTVNRHKWIDVRADSILHITNIEDVNDNNLKHNITEVTDLDMRLSGMDAFIFQHELDHLNGVLITDLEEVLTNSEKAHRRQVEKLQKKALKKSKKNLRQSYPKTTPTATPQQIKAEAIKEAKANGLFS